MTETEIRDALVAALRGVAPELEPATLDPAAPIRDQVDIDSIDFLRLLVALHEKLGVDVPETDYARTTTLNAFVAYLSERLTGPAAARSG